MISSTYPRKEFVTYKLKIPIPQILDVVEQLKKAPTHVSLWDLLSIPEQKNRLKEALFNGRKDVSGSTPKSP